MHARAVVATIFHILRVAAMFCSGTVFLYLAHREPEIKFYAFYAATFAIFMSFIGLFGSGHVYRMSRDQTNPQPSAKNVTKNTSTEDVWEDEKLQGVSNTAELLV